MYDYGLIDAQYLLVRNKCLQASYAEGNKINSSSLIQLTLQSIMKLKRENDFKYGILLWDKKPYYKESVLTGYKANRWVPTEEEKLQCEAILADPNSSEENRSYAESTLISIDVETHNYEVQQEVKQWFINDLPAMGFKSIIREGFEADDLAYLTAQMVHHLGYTGILISADSDWINLVNDSVTYISPKGGNTYPDLVNYRNQYLDKVDGDCYAYGILYELYWGGHNNIGGDTDGITFDDFLYKIYHEDSSLDKYDIFKARYDAMNIRNHADEVTDQIHDTLMDKTCDKSLLAQYLVSKSFYINFAYYNNYVDCYD